MCACPFSFCTRPLSLVAVCAAEAEGTPERPSSPANRDDVAEPPSRTPVSASADDPAHVLANLRLCGSPMRGSMVRRMSVDPVLASRLADFLHEHWVPNGRLVLPSSNPNTRRKLKLQGYVTYPLTVEPHDSDLQSRHTLLLLTKARLDAFRTHAPGFAAIESAVLANLDATGLDTFKDLLSSAHVLLQSQETLSTTIFTSHQDTENDAQVTDTVVIKLTADAVGEAASAMRVVGAPELFFYAPAAGSAGAFSARLYHISRPPVSDRPHIKLTLFCKHVPGGSSKRRKLDWFNID